MMLHVSTIEVISVEFNVRMMTRNGEVRRDGPSRKMEAESSDEHYYQSIGHHIRKRS
jgi:hypothetical protein